MKEQKSFANNLDVTLEVKFLHCMANFVRKMMVSKGLMKLMHIKSVNAFIMMFGENAVEDTCNNQLIQEVRKLIDRQPK